MYRKLLFDLDGTLTDPKEGICRSVQYALRAFGIEEPDIDRLEPFIGPPLADSFMEFYGMTRERALEAVEKYRERFSTVGLYENTVYDGIPQMLGHLREAGYELAVASSKPTVFVERILTHFGLSGYFSVVVGSELSGARVNKDEVIEETLRRLFAGERRDCAEVLMIGDRKFDVEGARAHGMSCVGVTYGYAPQGELEQSGALYLADSPAGLERLLLRLYEGGGQEGIAGEAGSFWDDHRGMARFPEPGGGEARRTPLLIAADVFLPLLVYYVVSNVALYLLNVAVQFVLERTIADGTAWILAHASALRVADNAAAMCIGAFCVRRQLLQETAGGGEPIAVKPGRMAAGWLQSGAAAFRKEWRRYAAPVLCGAAAALALNFPVSFFRLAAHDQVYRETAAVQYAVPLWLGLIAYGIVSPIAEEIVFRGILYRKCRRYLQKPLLAAVLSALVFGVLHGNVVQGAYGFLMGLMITWFYEKTGRFLTPVLVHAAANVSVFLYSFVGPEENAGTTVLYCVICTVISVCCVLFFEKKDKKQK